MQYNSIQFTYSLSYRPAPTFTRFALWFSSNWVWNQPTHHTIQFILPMTSIHCLGNIPHRRYLRLLFRSFNVQMLIWQTSGSFFFFLTTCESDEFAWSSVRSFRKFYKNIETVMWCKFVNLICFVHGKWWINFLPVTNIRIFYKF